MNKHEVYLTKTKSKNVKVIKRYIQSTLSNIVKTGSEQIEQMSPSFSFCLTRHSK